MCFLVMCGVVVGALWGWGMQWEGGTPIGAMAILFGVLVSIAMLCGTLRAVLTGGNPAVWVIIMCSIVVGASFRWGMPVWAIASLTGMMICAFFWSVPDRVDGAARGTTTRPPAAAPRWARRVLASLGSTLRRVWGMLAWALASLWAVLGWRFVAVCRPIMRWVVVVCRPIMRWVAVGAGWVWRMLGWAISSLWGMLAWAFNTLWAGLVWAFDRLVTAWFWAVDTIGYLGNPQPSTLNPQPSTLNPQPSTLNPQPSTLNPQGIAGVLGIVVLGPAAAEVPFSLSLLLSSLELSDTNVYEP